MILHEVVELKYPPKIRAKIDQEVVLRSYFSPISRIFFVVEEEDLSFLFALLFEKTGAQMEKIDSVFTVFPPLLNIVRGQV